MGLKLFLTGLFIFLALPKLVTGYPLELVGAIIMFIGVVLLWLNM